MLESAQEGLPYTGFGDSNVNDTAIPAGDNTVSIDNGWQGVGLGAGLDLSQFPTNTQGPSPTYTVSPDSNNGGGVWSLLGNLVSHGADILSAANGRGTYSGSSYSTNSGLNQGTGNASQISNSVNTLMNMFLQYLPLILIAVFVLAVLKHR